MNDIPLGKALVPMESNGDCAGCFYENRCNSVFQMGKKGCFPKERKDGKSVIFKLVDYPGTIE